MHTPDQSPRDTRVVKREQCTIRTPMERHPDFVPWMREVAGFLEDLGLYMNGGAREVDGHHELTVRATDNHIAIGYLIGIVRQRGLGIVIGMWTGPMGGTDDAHAEEEQSTADRNAASVPA